MHCAAMWSDGIRRFCFHLFFVQLTLRSTLSGPHNIFSNFIIKIVQSTGNIVFRIYCHDFVCHSSFCYADFWYLNHQRAQQQRRRHHHRWHDNDDGDDDFVWKFPIFTPHCICNWLETHFMRGERHCALLWLQTKTHGRIINRLFLALDNVTPFSPFAVIPHRPNSFIFIYFDCGNGFEIQIRLNH